MGLAEEILNGSVSAAARLISEIENSSPDAEKELDILYPYTGKAYILGITGAPGTGKSTLINNLINHFCESKLKVGVVAIDPSSPFTGGALLGDRIRMQHHSSHDDVFIRSLATRGCLGGLARAAVDTIHVMDTMGKDIIMVETVGTGQSEVQIRHVADTTVVVLAPGMGDDIQAMKAGIMEIASIFVVNKADKGGAEEVVMEIEQMLDMRMFNHEEWRPLIIVTEAVSAKGLDRLIESISRHREFLSGHGGLQSHRREAARQELVTVLQDMVADYYRNGIKPGGYLEKLVSAAIDNRQSPRHTAQRIITLFSGQVPRNPDNNTVD